MRKTIIYIVTVIAVTFALTVSASALNTDAYNTVYAGLAASEEKIDLSEYTVTKSELSEIFNEIINTSPELFYVSSEYRYSYDEGEPDIALSLIPQYTLSGDSLASAQKTYSGFITSITSGVKSSWSDAEKALYIHDQIILRSEYDLTIADVYNFAKSGKGNCTAYSLTFLAACEKVGLACDVAVSTSMNHMWNVVKIDGEWYHADITWDDPVNDIRGRALHSNFLKSDSGIVNASVNQHTGWDKENTPACTSAKYDSSIWNDVASPFVYLDGDWYAVSNKNFSLAMFDFDKSSVTDIAPIDDKWRVEGSSTQIYVDAYSSTGIYDDFVYFNTPTEVWSYNVKTGDITTVFTLTTDEYITSGQIYFFTVKDSTLTYYLSKSPQATQKTTGNVDLKVDASTFTVTFVVNGETVSSADYSEGEHITAPQIGKVDGFIFSGWEDLPETMPANDITVNAILTECPHANTENKIIAEETCTKDGEGNVVCIECGHIVNTYKIKGEHNLEDWKVAKEATCTEDGLRQRSCKKCLVTVEEEKIPAKGSHSYGKWVIIKEATEDKDGERERTCSECGHVDVQTYSVSSDTTETEAPDTTESDTTTEKEPDTSVTDPDTGVTESDPVTDGYETPSDSEYDTPVTGDANGNGGSFNIKSFFVYFTIIIIDVVCVVGIVLIFRFAFIKPKPKKKKSTDGKAEAENETSGKDAPSEE